MRNRVSSAKAACLNEFQAGKGCPMCSNGNNNARAIFKFINRSDMQESEFKIHQIPFTAWMLF